LKRRKFEKGTKGPLCNPWYYLSTRDEEGLRYDSDIATLSLSFQNNRK